MRSMGVIVASNFQELRTADDGDYRRRNLAVMGVQRGDHLVEQGWSDSVTARPRA